MGVVEESVALGHGDAEQGPAAAAWAAAFHPGVSVCLDAGMAKLTSPDRSPAELRTIWRAALLNERLLAKGNERRSAVLQGLVR